MMPLQELKETKWDVVVIGTGMGGATLGYALAKAGKKVLFCERGHSSLLEGALRGHYAEDDPLYGKNSGISSTELFERAGRYSKEWIDIARRGVKFVPFIGSGTGGSSALYGAVMERFSPNDFKKQWPITYAQLAPYYEAAEQLYGVRGDEDPLLENEHRGYVSPHFSGLSPVGKELHSFFKRKGLHPYIPPMACGDPIDKLSSCQGYLCADGCKNDSAKMCLKPAIEKYGARLVDRCEVVRMEATATNVTGVVCNWNGEHIVLYADTYILAAGALETPLILARSSSPSWPHGLANSSGLVGKNLMRHFVDLWLIFTKARPEPELKEVSFNDLYEDRGVKLGSVQSFGSLPSARIVTESLIQDLRDSHFFFLAPLLRVVRPVAIGVLSWIFSRTVVLATIIEDFPQEDNHIDMSFPEKSMPSFYYHIKKTEMVRINAMRKRMRTIIKPYKHLLLKEAQNNVRLAHVCGTCRFGDDPNTSVLDRNNRAHEVGNLYVVDSSFFPTSGGTNFALTIAANALRVADSIVLEKK